MPISKMPGEGNQRERRTLLAAAGLMVVIGILFCGVVGCGFVNFDDNRYVTENPPVREGWSGRNVVWAFRLENPAGLWIPLTWLSLQGDATVSGSAGAAVARPKGVLPGSPPPFPPAGIYHLDNLLLQMIAAAALFVFLYRATGARWTALAASFFWAIHPLRVESVAWVTERKDVLAGVFGFLAMWAYVGWARRGGWRGLKERQERWRIWGSYLGLCGLFLLSEMAKPMFVTLPCLLLLVDAWPLRRLRTWTELALRAGEKSGLWVISGGIAGATFFAQRNISAVKTLRDLGMGERLEHTAVSYVIYIVRQVRVWDLAAYYPYGDRPGLGVALACAAALAAVSVACVWQRRRRPWLLMGWLWYLGTMVPMSGLMQAGEQGSADRFTYLPSVGLWIMVVFTAREILMAAAGRAGRGVARAAVFGAAAVYAVVMMGFTVRQVGYWQNTETLGNRTLAVTHGNWFMHEMMAIAYLRQGRNELADEHFKRALDLGPTVEEDWFAAGFFHLQMGRLAEATKELARAARLRPQDGQAHLYHGVALERSGQDVGAILEYRNALLLEPRNRQAAAGLDRTMQDTKALEQAVRYAPELRRR